MFRNHIKIAWRNLLKNKVYSLINILGLATGMTVTLLIALWIWDEVTYDRYHENHRDLAEVMTTYINQDGSKGTGNAVCMPVGQELRTKYGGDFKDISMASWMTTHSMMVGDKKLIGRGMWVEQGFPAMFSLRMIEGDRNALGDPSSILINASLARSLFGKENALHKTIRLDNKLDFSVAGVFEDLPQNTTLSEAQLFTPWKKYITTEAWLATAANEWNNHSWQAYVQVNPGFDIGRVSERIRNATMVHKIEKTEGKEEITLLPMDQWRLRSEYENGKATTGRIRFVWLFGVIGLFVLLLACINFMNLSTARSEKRAREVGVRKTLGSMKSQLIGQFLGESLLVASLSFVLSILLALALLPVFNQLADKQIGLPLGYAAFWILALAFTLFTGLLAGSYPAFYLSRFKPVKVLKGTLRVGKLASLPRKILVVVQFTFSIALVIGTIIVYRQVQYAQDRPVHYDRNGLITIGMNTPDLSGHYDAIRNDLLATGVVGDMAESSCPTTGVWSNTIGFNWEGKDPNTLPGFGTIAVTKDFGKTIGWEIKEGRDFSKEFATDSLAMILNEAAVQQIAMKKDIVGQAIQYNEKNYHVVGVVRDMVMESPYQKPVPTVFLCDYNWANVITVRIKPGVGVQSALARIQPVFLKFNPSSPFDFTFNDQDYQKKFADEQRIGRLAAFFTALAIFISCLGLFGLSSFVAEQRKKEIGVRKVLGASIASVWRMLSREFALLVLLSSLISIPLAWYYLHEWLNHYEYKAGIEWWIFIVSALGALAITLITVSFQAIRAALANPVKSLRTE